MITPDFTWKPLAKHHGEGWGSEEEAEKIISGPDPDPDLAREFILKYTKDPRYRLSTTCYVIFAKIELKEAQRIADGIEAQDQAEAAQKRQVAEERIKQGQALAEQVTSEPDSALTFLNGPPADDDEWVMLEEFLAQSGGPDKLADGARKVAIDFAKQSQCETAADLALCERWLAVFPEHELAEGVRVKVEAVLSDNLVAYLDFSRDSWRAASKKLGTLRAEMERFTAEGRAQAQERVILKLASLNPSVDSPTQLDVEAADAVLAAVVEMGGQGSNTHKTLASKGRKLRAKHAKVAAANKRRAKADAARSGQASKKSDKVFKCTLGCITKAENRCAGKTKRGLTNPYDLCVSSYLKSCCKKCGTTINTNNYQTCFY